MPAPVAPAAPAAPVAQTPVPAAPAPGLGELGGLAPAPAAPAPDAPATPASAPATQAVAPPLRGNRVQRKPHDGRRGPSDKFTPEIASAIVAALTLGMDRKQACHVAGISRRSFSYWRVQGLESPNGMFGKFARDVRAAESKGIFQRLARITQAGGLDWRADAWWLEHVKPAQFAKNRIEISGPGGGPIGIAAVRCDCANWLSALGPEDRERYSELRQRGLEALAAEQASPVAGQRAAVVGNERLTGLVERRKAKRAAAAAAAAVTVAESAAPLAAESAPESAPSEAAPSEASPSPEPEASPAPTAPVPTSPAPPAPAAARVLLCPDCGTPLGTDLVCGDCGAAWA